jgi:hypothetical protein
MTKILICGDSFAADWTVKYPGQGWPNMIAKQFDTTNISQAGCSQYKIYLQLKSVNLEEYDVIIISHTSPNRLYVTEHPIHHSDILHCNSDLIYADIINRDGNAKLKPVVDYFERYFDLDHAEFTHNLICKEIEEVVLRNVRHKVINMTGFDWDRLYQFDDMVSFVELMRLNRGTMNHFNEAGNRIVFETLCDRISKI